MRQKIIDFPAVIKYKVIAFRFASAGIEVYTRRSIFSQIEMVG